MKREYDFSKAKRGPVVPVPKGKTRITIRLDDDVIEWFRDQVNKAGGGNYQSLTNDALRDHIGRAREPLRIHPAPRNPRGNPPRWLAIETY
jgi:uncharacterized protein (DUF4415 family)